MKIVNLFGSIYFTIKSYSQLLENYLVQTLYNILFDTSILDSCVFLLAHCKALVNCLFGPLAMACGCLTGQRQEVLVEPNLLLLSLIISLPADVGEVDRVTGEG